MTHRRKKCCGLLLRYCGLGVFVCERCAVIYVHRPRR